MEKLTALCGGALLALSFAAEAQAGFLALDAVSSDPPAAATAQPSSAPVETPQRGPSAPQFDRDDFRFGLPTAPGSFGGMGSVSLDGPSGPPAVAVVIPSKTSPGLLTAYLLGEPAVHHPVPFLDGVFRPPR